MKPKFSNLLAVAIATVCFAGTLHAAEITWDTAATTGIQGGAGTWGAFTTNWTSDSGVSRVAWNNVANAADTALFTTGSGRVAVDGTINLKGITNNSIDTSTIGGRTISYLMEGTGSLNFGSEQGVIDTLASGLTNLQVNNNLIGSGGLSINAANAPTTGQGYIALAGTNTGLTGGISVENGLLGVNGLGSLGTNAVTLNGNAGLFGPIDIAGPSTTATAGPGNLTLAVPVSVNGTGNVLRVWGSRTLTLSAALTGSGDVSKSDGGTLVLNNATGYSGVLTQTAGSINVGGDFGGSISAATGSISLGGSLAGNLSLAGPANVSVAGSISGNVTLDSGGVLSVGGNLPGTLTFTQGRLSLGGSYTGDVVIINPNSDLVLGPLGVITGNITTEFNNGQTLVIEGQVTGSVSVEELVSTRLAGAEITGDLTLGFDDLSTQTRATITRATVAVGGDLKVNGSATLVIDGTIPSGTPILTFANLITETANPADHITVVAPPSFTDVVVTYNSGSIVVTYTPGSLAATWDTSSAPGIQIGAGTWSESIANWTDDAGSTNNFWTNGSAAVFAGNLSASTYIDLGGAISVNNLSRTGNNNLRIRSGTGNTLAISGNVDVATGSYVTLEALGDNQFTGSFAKTGEGLLEINGADSRFAFSSVTLSAGTIGFFGGTGFQSESIALNGGAIGSLTAAGRDLNGAVSIGGNIAIGDDAGSVLSNGAMNFGSSGTVNLGGASRTLTIGSDVNFNGVVSDGGITKEGSGRLTLASVGNTLGGATVVNAGELRVSSAIGETGLLGTLGSGSVSVNSGATLRFFTGSTSNAKSYANAINLSNGTLIGEDGIHTLTGKVDLTGANNINVQWSGKNLILEGEVKGTGSFTKGTAASTLILAANNTYGGTTTISGGILQIGNGGTTGTLGGGAVSIGGAGLYINRSNAYTIGNDLSGGGGFQNNGSGTTTLTGNNTRTGSTAINGGILEVASLADAGGVGSAGAVTSEFSFLSIGNTGTLRYTGSGTESTSRNLFMQSAGGTKTIDVANASGNLTFTSTGGQLSGAIAKTGLGSLTLTKNVELGASVTVDGGSLTLLGLNSYSGETRVNAGILSLVQAGLSDSSTVRIGSGAILNLPHGTPDTVAKLFVNGVQQPATTYNSGNSAFITGTGSLVVTENPPAGYATWIDTYFPGVTNPLIVGSNADPDGDSVANIVEFLTSGVPNDGSQKGLLWIGVSGNQLVMSLAMRGAATTFSGTPSPSTTVDGTTAAIQGSLDLSSFSSPVSGITFVLPAGWSASPPAGYSYHSFKLDASTGLPNKGFMRLNAVQP